MATIITARTKSGAIKQLQAEMTKALNAQDKWRYEKLTALYEDSVFDQYLTLENIKWRAKTID